MFPAPSSDRPPASQDTAPDLLVHWHSRSGTFFHNLLDTVFPRHEQALELTSTPTDSFWQLVFVKHPSRLRFIFDSYNVSLAEAIERPNYLTDHFARVSAALGYRVDPPEDVTDLIGRVALGRDTTAAIRILGMNAKLYPSSASALTSLGDAWVAKGDTAKAIGYYERAVALRPGLKRPKEALRKLKPAP